jgi:hypothetical protein
MKPVVMFLALATAGCGERIDETERKSDEWDQWARGVEKKFPVADTEGHGPDVGSEEWARALPRKLGIVDADGHGPDLGSAEWRAAVEEKIGGLVE